MQHWVQSTRPTVLADEPDLAWRVQRNRQIHDVVHTRLDLGAEGHEEILVQAFILGNVGFPQSFFIMHPA